jgi:small redox-active disulfide protein 2
VSDLIMEAHRMITVKVLGSGCPNCKKVEAIARAAAARLGLPAEFIKVTDYAEITAYPILSTPGLVINEKVVASGRIPSEAQVMEWLQAAVEPPAA